jgi:hypothetical protein
MILTVPMGLVGSIPQRIEFPLMGSFEFEAGIPAHR